jgi:hypothetical protein
LKQLFDNTIERKSKEKPWKQTKIASLVPGLEEEALGEDDHQSLEEEDLEEAWACRQDRALVGPA